MERVPVTILTGFLGSGKTTLLNHILKSQHGKRIAVIENEYGEVAVDSEFVLDAGQEIFVTQNGCICCKVRGDLSRILHELMKEREGEFDMVLIETTGMADPGPVIQTILTDDQLLSYFKIDGVVTMVDAGHILLTLDETNQKSQIYQQIAFADTILLNKVDIINDQHQLDTLKQQLQKINDVPIHSTKYGIISLDHILNLGGFDLERIDKHISNSKDNDHHHSDNNEVMSVGIDESGELDFDLLNLWIQSILASMGDRIYRSKGILNVHNEKDRFIFHGVHMFFDGQQDRAWKDGEERRNKLIFIGKKLDKDAIINSFKKCIL
ncbi:unnamed protein product [Cunninghamella blakesleeana]